MIQRNLTIFLKNGETLRFNKVEDVQENLSEGSLRFTYTYVSDETRKGAFFVLNNIAGSSISVF